MNHNTLTQSTQKLISRYQQWQDFCQTKKDDDVIQVDEVASKVTTFYEKIKGVVDWREEHLLRKRAIERSLKRLIVFGDHNGPNVARDLIHELIRGGYFPNNSISTAKVSEIKTILDKYIYIINHIKYKEKNDEIYLQNWLIKIASYEIEKKLSPAFREDTLMKYMTVEMIKRIKLRDEGITANMSEEEKNIQIYIATQRAIFKIDKFTITYNLLERKFPNWTKLTSSSPELADITNKIYEIKNGLDADLNNPLLPKFIKICERYDTPFLILSDIIADDPALAENRLTNPRLLQEAVSKFYHARLTALKGVMRRAAIYSTVSIFITKVLFSLITEIPFDIFVTDQFHYSVLAINLLFPPFLMYLLVATAKLPGEDNLQKVIAEVRKIVLDNQSYEMEEIRAVPPKNKMMRTLVVMVYILTYVLTFGVVIYVLKLLHFSIFSTVIFLIFLSTISFLGIKIRERGRELNVESNKETIWQTVVIFFFFPVVRAGKWLIDRWSGLEVTLFITVLIDMPFLAFVAFIEQWTHFLRERREEIS